MDQFRVARSPEILPGEPYEGDSWMPAEAEFCQFFEESVLNYQDKWGENTHWFEFRVVPDEQVEPAVQAMYDKLIYSRTPEGQLETIRQAKELYGPLLDLPPQGN